MINERQFGIPHRKKRHFCLPAPRFDRKHAKNDPPAKIHKKRNKHTLVAGEK